MDTAHTSKTTTPHTIVPIDGTLRAELSAISQDEVHEPQMQMRPSSSISVQNQRQTVSQKGQPKSNKAARGSLNRNTRKFVQDKSIKLTYFIVPYDMSAEVWVLILLIPLTEIFYLSL